MIHCLQVGLFTDTLVQNDDFVPQVRPEKKLTHKTLTQKEAPKDYNWLMERGFFSVRVNVYAGVLSELIYFYCWLHLHKSKDVINVK